MEVRVDRKGRARPKRKTKKQYSPWKALAALAALCLVLMAFFWNQGRKSTAQASSFWMAQDAQGRYIFNVVEVVPNKKHAVLGLFIKGEDKWTIPLSVLNNFVNTSSFEDNKGPAESGGIASFFYWEGKTFSTGNEPYTIVENEAGKRTVINNEIFKLYMMGFGKFDKNKSIYQNYQDNQKVLERFDEEYVINYQVVTPDELNRMDLSEINYLHISSGSQISNFPNLYNLVGMGVSWDESFKSDFSWETARTLYEQAITDTPRMSISISSYAMYGNGTSQGSNIYKLYQMLHYFDDPSLFKQMFKSKDFTGEFTNSGTSYVDWDTGIVYAPYEPPLSSWWLNAFDKFNLKGNPHVGMNESRPGERNEGYIPGKFDNILTYGDQTTAFSYFDKILSTDYINQILHFQGSKPTPPEPETDGLIKVLELEPCNSYYLAVRENLENLATAIDVDADKIAVTFATPNRLNGMAVDLAAEYDLILIGDDTSWFADNSSYSASDPYRHIGSYEDAVTLQTAFNGLLKGDYTTESEFNKALNQAKINAVLNKKLYSLEPSASRFWNDGLRKQWKGEPDSYFLKNMELALLLKTQGASGSAVEVTRSRFSGNDVTRYMQGQLVDFIESGQPVVAARNVYNRASELADGKVQAGGDKPDARLYLALDGIREDFGEEDAQKGGLLTSVYIKEENLGIDGKKISLKRRFKPTVQIRDVSLAKGDKEPKAENDGEVNLPKIAERGKPGEAKPDLNALEKSNYLSFYYEIGVPEADEIQNCIMKIIVDQNGDGMFDEEGEGKTVSGGKRGKQNNDAKTIKNDRVFEFDFSEAVPGADYTVTENKDEDGRTILSGIYRVPGALNSLEEMCQFRVTVSTKDKANSLRGVWTGYWRPDLLERDVKVLQITPYPGDPEKNSLSKNERLIKFLEEAKNKGGEYHFQFNDPEYYTVIQEDDFAAECESTSERDMLDWLGQFDLIISGTDFTCQAHGDEVDFGELKAAEVLKKYAGELKGPIIFTNDAASHVNSYNYVTPVEKNYYYRNLTMEEGVTFSGQGGLNESSGQFRRLEITEKEYGILKGLNSAAAEFNFTGEGTVFLDDSLLHDKVVKSGAYQAILCPLPEESAKGQDTRDTTIAYLSVSPDGSHSSEAGFYLDAADVDGKIHAIPLDSAMNQGDLSEAVKERLVYQGEGGSVVRFYSRTGYVTEDQLSDMYTMAIGPDGAGEREIITCGIKTEKGEETVFRYSDLHRLLWIRESIPEQLVDKEKPVIIHGVDFPLYRFTAGDGKQYLAVKRDDLAADSVERFGYLWQAKTQYESSDGMAGKEYILTDVAGTAGALYPHQNVWNYYFTQSMRYALGMDRFAVTLDQEVKKKRDSGSSYEGEAVKEIQGFTNAVLLEFSYLPPKDAQWKNTVGLNLNSPYADDDGDQTMKGALELGAAPRTDVIEAVNEGPIGLYPFKIAAEDYSETKIEILKNHAPYYQLDLDRELGEGKIDDVTVWYTFAGARDSGQDKKRESRYFDVTAKDAGNNYYLYSKGKIYYTGFSLRDEEEKEDEAESGDRVPDMELKLFVNTLYAALGSRAEGAADYYETLVKETGSVSRILKAGEPGQNHQYACYFGEDKEKIEMWIRIQRENAAAEETASLVLSCKDGLDESGREKITPLPEGSYQLQEGIPQQYFPVKTPLASEPAENGENEWYLLTIPFSEEGYGQGFWDGKTVVIGTGSSASAAVSSGAINSEVRLVLRSLFDLD